MKRIFFIMAMSVLLAMPCALRAEEMVIPLVEVVNVGTLPGDNPLDGPEQSPDVPPHPYDFRAVINGNTLSVEKQKESIPSAKVTVVNVTTGSVVTNEQFTSIVTKPIATPGVYVLRIETTGGALVGQFVVQ